MAAMPYDIPTVGVAPVTPPKPLFFCAQMNLEYRRSLVLLTAVKAKPTGDNAVGSGAGGSGRSRRNQALGAKVGGE